MMRQDQSQSTLGNQHKGQGYEIETKKQNPSPPPRYHDLADKYEMGISISPSSHRDSREVDPEKTRDVGFMGEFEPRSATMKLMVIIFSLIIMSTFSGIFYAIARLNQIEITIQAQIPEMKTIINLKNELKEDINRRDNVEEGGYNLLDAKLRLIESKLQDLFNSNKDSMKVKYPSPDESSGVFLGKGSPQEYEYMEDPVIAGAGTYDIEEHQDHFQDVTPISDDDFYLNYEDEMREWQEEWS